MDGEYEWDESDQQNGKKSRSKLPQEDKLNVSANFSIEILPQTKD
jgi:hypothetical protein